MRDFPAGGVLIGAEKGLFLAREVNGAVTAAPVGAAETGDVSMLRDFPGGGALIRADTGLFLAREVSGKVTVAPFGDADIGPVSVRALSGGVVLIGTYWKLLVAVTTSLAIAQVDIGNRKSLDSSPINREVTIRFLMAHPCAPVAEKLGLMVRITPPSEKPTNSDQPYVASRPKIAEIAISRWIGKADQWSFQLIATSGGIVREVGEVQTLAFVRMILGGNDGGNG